MRMTVSATGVTASQDGKALRTYDGNESRATNSYTSRHELVRSPRPHHPRQGVPRKRRCLRRTHSREARASFSSAAANSPGSPTLSLFCTRPRSISADSGELRGVGIAKTGPHGTREGTPLLNGLAAAKPFGPAPSPLVVGSCAGLVWSRPNTAPGTERSPTVAHRWQHARPA
jgi:hypothetical protein